MYKLLNSALNHSSLTKQLCVDNIVSEHLLHCQPSIIIPKIFYLTFMSRHSFVSNDFSQGIIIPIIKERTGDLSSVGN